MKSMKYLLASFMAFVPFAVDAAEDCASLYDDSEYIACLISESDSIVLEEDVDLTETGLQVSSDLTIDLNGFTIEVQNGDSHNIDVNNGATLTLNDSSEDESGLIYSETTLSNGGRGAVDVDAATFVMNAGTITVTDTDYSSNAVLVFYGTEENPSTVIINGGEINATGSSISNHNTMGGNTYIEINGGTLNSGIYSTYTATPANHDLTINGGVVSDVTFKSSYVAFDAGITPELIVTGGEIGSLNISMYDDTYKVSKIFSLDITGGVFGNDVTEYINETVYEVVESDDTYTVQLIMPELTFDEVSYN